MPSLLIERAPLGFPWATVDPFLFCAYHDDTYPAGDGALGVPPALLGGRRLGMDFERRDGFRMYHGHHVPGFPSHPHRGFETVTLVRKGYCDHSDSLGAAARFGAGDAQWITTGAGIVHSEMFPLLESARPNRLELFQIWLNLPAASKFAPAHFSMLWRDAIPRVERRDTAGRRSLVTVVAGELDGQRAPAPPPDSWASRPSSDVAIWTLELEAEAELVLPPASEGSSRALYFFDGAELELGAELVREHGVLLVRPERELALRARGAAAGLLLLQGRPIGEPVAQHGPFVMNTREELVTAVRDYQRTNFGGWPWPDDAPVHDAARGRFARYADGQEQELPR
jgi:hypothetical protein